MSDKVMNLVCEARGRIQEISALELAAAVAADAVVIDVREAGEYAAGHLPQAINLPRGVLEFRVHAHPALSAETAPAPESRPIVLYCLTGGRSALAAESLQRLGFERVRSLAGGVAAWCQAGLPLVQPAAESD